MRNKEEGVAGEGGAWPLRLVSYNILADAYASTKFAREQLYGYCPASALSVDYRKQLAAWELMGYSADVLCLQEVSQDVYDTYLEPVLRSKGYSGVYSNKISPHTKIGCATFWRHDRLALVNLCLYVAN
jgi:mRNA deadenylase 3'-5' endonuclease subunit Ccr4